MVLVRDSHEVLTRADPHATWVEQPISSEQTNR